MNDEIEYDESGNPRTYEDWATDSTNTTNNYSNNSSETWNGSSSGDSSDSSSGKETINYDTVTEEANSSFANLDSEANTSTKQEAHSSSITEGTNEGNNRSFIWNTIDPEEDKISSKYSWVTETTDTIKPTDTTKTTETTETTDTTKTTETTDATETTNPTSIETTDNTTKTTNPTENKVEDFHLGKKVEDGTALGTPEDFGFTEEQMKESMDSEGLSEGYEKYINYGNEFRSKAGQFISGAIETSTKSDFREYLKNAGVNEDIISRSSADLYNLNSEGIPVERVLEVTTDPKQIEHYVTDVRISDANMPAALNLYNDLGYIANNTVAERIKSIEALDYFYENQPNNELSPEEYLEIRKTLCEASPLESLQMFREDHPILSIAIEFAISSVIWGAAGNVVKTIVPIAKTGKIWNSKVVQSAIDRLSKTKVAQTAEKVKNWWIAKKIEILNKSKAKSKINLGELGNAKLDSFNADDIKAVYQKAYKAGDTAKAQKSIENLAKIDPKAAAKAAEEVNDIKNASYYKVLYGNARAASEYSKVQRLVDEAATAVNKGNYKEAEELLNLIGTKYNLRTEPILSAATTAVSSLKNKKEQGNPVTTAAVAEALKKVAIAGAIAAYGDKAAADTTAKYDEYGKNIDSADIVNHFKVNPYEGDYAVTLDTEEGTVTMPAVEAVIVGEAEKLTEKQGYTDAVKNQASEMAKQGEYDNIIYSKYTAKKTGNPETQQEGIDEYYEDENGQPMTFEDHKYTTTYPETTKSKDIEYAENGQPKAFEDWVVELDEKGNPKTFEDYTPTADRIEYAENGQPKAFEDWSVEVVKEDTNSKTYTIRNSNEVYNYNVSNDLINDKKDLEEANSRITKFIDFLQVVAGGSDLNNDGTITFKEQFKTYGNYFAKIYDNLVPDVVKNTVIEPPIENTAGFIEDWLANGFTYAIKNFAKQKVATVYNVKNNTIYAIKNTDTIFNSVKDKLVEAKDNIVNDIKNAAEEFLPSWSDSPVKNLIIDGVNATLMAFSPLFSLGAVGVYYAAQLAADYTVSRIQELHKLANDGQELTPEEAYKLRIAVACFVGISDPVGSTIRTLGEASKKAIHQNQVKQVLEFGSTKISMPETITTIIPVVSTNSSTGEAASSDYGTASGTIAADSKYNGYVEEAKNSNLATDYNYGMSDKITSAVSDKDVKMYITKIYSAEPKFIRNAISKIVSNHSEGEWK